MELGSNLPKTTTKKLSNGVLGNLETIQVMKRVAKLRSSHPLVRQLALNILNFKNVVPQNYADEAIAIAQYVKKHVRYVRDIKGVETLHDPLTMIDQIKRGVAQGDCDDISLLIATLLLSIGHQPYFKTVRYKSNFGPYNHIYVVVYEKNYGEKKKRKIVLDGILKQPIGFEVPHKSSKEHKI